ncbi:MAG: energy transducer TonB [Paludibacteraceae bacterium]|nr:energy transducer TonB [Paludibacteraceae bacterium]
MKTFNVLLLMALLTICGSQNTFAIIGVDDEPLFYVPQNRQQDDSKKTKDDSQSSENPADEDDDEDDDVVFQVVEKMPEFQGGTQALFKYLSENVKYPANAQENGIQGRVICQFVVNKNGSIVDVEVVRSGGDPSLDEEAIRVIKAMPKWIPGKQRGKNVRVKYSLPVNFKLH